MKLKRFLGAVLAVAMTVTCTAISALAAENEQSPITGAVTANGRYSYSFGITGETITGETTKVYNYDDDYGSIRVGLANVNDTITGDGIKYNGAGCGESNSIKDTGRFILVKPTYSGKVFVTYNRNNSSASSYIRMYATEFTVNSFDEVDLSILKKNAPAGVGETYSATNQFGSHNSNGTFTDSFDVTAGKIYSIHVYNLATTISALGYESSDFVLDAIAGAATAGSYTLNLGKPSEAKGKSTYDYEDDYAAIRLGVGDSDTVTTNGIYWSNPSCKGNSGDGDYSSSYDNASVTNRYIMIQPKYSGSLQIKLKAASGVGTSAKLRVYHNDFGSAATFDNAGIDTLKKGVGTAFDDVTDTNEKTFSFNIEASHIYSLHTYNRAVTFTSILYTSDSITAPATIDGEATKFTEGATDGKYTGSDGSVAVAYTTQFTNSTDNTTYVTPEIVWTVNDQVGKTVKHSILSNLKSGETTDKYGLVIHGGADDADDIEAATVSVQLAPQSTITEEVSGGE